MDCTETPLLNLMEPPVGLLDMGSGKIQADKETQAAAPRVSGGPPGKVPHQANKRIIDGMAGKLGLPSQQIVCTVDHHGNTSAASIPLAFTEAVTDGRIRAGNLVLMQAIGDGLSWGAALVRT